MDNKEKIVAELTKRLQTVIEGYKGFNRAKVALKSVLKDPPITKELSTVAEQQNMRSVILEVYGSRSYDDGFQKSPMAGVKEIITKAGQTCNVEAGLHIAYTETKKGGRSFKESFNVFHSFDFKTNKQGKIEQDSFTAKPAIVSNIISEEGFSFDGKPAQSTNRVFVCGSFDKDNQKILICVYVVLREQAEKQVHFSTSGLYSEKYLHLELIEVPIKVIEAVSPDKIQADAERDISLAIQKLTVEISLPEEKTGTLSNNTKMRQEIYNEVLDWFKDFERSEGKYYADIHNLLIKGELRVVIEGYANSKGNAVTNEKLSEERAKFVADIVTRRLANPKIQVAIRPMGETDNKCFAKIRIEK